MRRTVYLRAMHEMNGNWYPWGAPSYYPGRRYVDVLAVDGYNWGAQRPNFGGWRSFAKAFRRPYRRLKRSGPQPIWIAETGSTSTGGNKARWVRQMFRQSRRMKRLRAIVWMDTVADGIDWRLLSPRTTARAFGQVRRR